MRYPVFLTERHLAVQSVNTAGTGINQVLYPIVAATFQHVQETVHIGFHVSIWVLYRITYPRLGCQMTYTVKTSVGKQHLHCLTVFQIHPDKTVAGMLTALHKLIPCHILPANSSLRQTGILQTHIVIVIDIIQTYHLISTLQQRLHHIRTDKTGCTGHQYLHNFFKYDNVFILLFYDTYRYSA